MSSGSGSGIGSDQPRTLPHATKAKAQWDGMFGVGWDGVGVGGVRYNKFLSSKVARVLLSLL